MMHIVEIIFTCTVSEGYNKGTAEITKKFANLDRIKIELI